MEQHTAELPHRQEEPHRKADSRRPSRRVVVFGVLMVLYVFLTLGVIFRSPLLTLDQDVFRLDLRERFPQVWHAFHTYVMLGQRGPATLVALPWFVWRAWKARSARPLIMLGTALLLLNLSVGVVKIWTGRLGPRDTHQVHAVFDGGDIFPSGHVSNAVVLYGVIAILAINWRRTVAAVAAFVAFTVGLTTVYLDTHWLTDVVGGWIAGALVLIVLPWVMPYSERVWYGTGRMLRSFSLSGPRAPSAPPAPRPPRRREPVGAPIAHRVPSRPSVVTTGARGEPETVDV